METLCFACLATEQPAALITVITFCSQKNSTIPYLGTLIYISVVSTALPKFYLSLINLVNSSLVLTNMKYNLVREIMNK